MRSFSSYYRTHPTEADDDGYLKNAQGQIVRSANQVAIGRKHFQRLNGNRTTHLDDGYNLRGRGLIQITGYEKYSGYMNDYKKYWNDQGPDTVNNPALINEMPHAIRSALWFWIEKKPYMGDKGNGLADVSDVTYIVNGGYNGLSERQKAYREIEDIIK